LRATQTASKREINDEQRMGMLATPTFAVAGKNAATDDACGNAAAFLPRAQKKRPSVLAN
jgi:hypothetical protein